MKRSLLGIVIFFAVLAIAAAATSGPIGLDWHPDGRLFVLLKDGGVSILDGVTKRKLAAIPSRFGVVPVEIFSARLKDGEYVFISGFWGRSGAVWQYTADGRPYARFETPQQAASFDVDGDRHLLYLASPVTNVVYSVDLDQHGSAAKRVAYVAEAKAIGPVVFDRVRNHVLLADTASGVLYDIDVTNGSYQQIASGLGRPISLGIGSAFKIMFVADSLSNRICVFRLENGTFKQTDAVPTGLRKLAAVSLGPDDTVFVADGTGVYQLSLKTKKLSRIAY
jgi:hypothetical protein